MDPADFALQLQWDFAEYLKRWEGLQHLGLTKETFLALHHTCLALADCSAY